MDLASAFFLLTSCWTVHSSASGQSVPFAMVFSAGTWLVVDISDQMSGDRFPHSGRNLADGPSIQIFASQRVSEDSESPRLLVCLLNRLKSPRQPTLWWLDHTPLKSARTMGSWTESAGGYSATLVLEVTAVEWRSRSSYWCGTIEEGRVFRQKLCSED